MGTYYNVFCSSMIKCVVSTCSIVLNEHKFHCPCVNRLFIEILQSTPSSEEEIEFFEDGSWKPKVEKEKNGKSNGSSYSSQASGSSRNGASAPVIQMIGGMDAGN